MPTVRFANLLARHKVTAIDLLQIDAEGFDFEVIKMLDLRAMKPAIIHYEHFHLSPADRRAANEYLAEHGYRFWSAGLDTTAEQG